MFLFLLITLGSFIETGPESVSSGYYVNYPTPIEWCVAISSPRKVEWERFDVSRIWEKCEIRGRDSVFLHQVVLPQVMDSILLGLREDDFRCYYCGTASLADSVTSHLILVKLFENDSLYLMNVKDNQLISKVLLSDYYDDLGLNYNSTYAIWTGELFHIYNSSSWLDDYYEDPQTIDEDLENTGARSRFVPWFFDHIIRPFRMNSFSYEEVGCLALNKDGTMKVI